MKLCDESMKSENGYGFPSDDNFENSLSVIA